MRKKVDPLYITLRNSKKRAVGAILLSIFCIVGFPLAIISNLIGYNEKEIPFYFYPAFLISINAIIRWIPSIKTSLKSPDYLVKNEDEGISVFGQSDNFSGHRFLKHSEIREINIENTFFKKNVIFELNDNSFVKIPMIFSDGLNN
jgi:hypothetical protein